MTASDTGRHDGDSWDLASSVGATATMVAAGRAMASKAKTPLINDPYADPLVRAVGVDFFTKMMDGELDFSLLPNSSPDRTQAIVDGMGIRTKYFDEYLLAAVQAGVRQVVILASGLDSRAYRLPWPDETTIFELDRPQVLDFKREVLAEQGAKPNAERREVAIDLREDWPQALRDSGFDAAKPSAWIAEGLLVYLPAAAEQQMFSGIDALAAPGSHVAVEDSAPMASEQLEAAIEEERAARAEGDQRLFFQLVYNERHAPADQWFDQHGWTAEPTPLADYLREVGRPVPGPDVEAGAMVARNTLMRAVKR